MELVRCIEEQNRDAADHAVEKRASQHAEYDTASLDPAAQASQGNAGGA